MKGFVTKFRVNNFCPKFDDMIDKLPGEEIPEHVIARATRVIYGPADVRYHLLIDEETFIVKQQVSHCCFHAVLM